MQRELRPGQSIELLKELHILTREGRLNQDSRRKLKQVYHLYQFIEKLLLELPDAGAHAMLADHGAGKSYLGFIVYDLFFKALGRAVMSTASRRRAELVNRSRELARAPGFRAHELPQPDSGRGRALAGAANAHRCRDGAARLRHSDRRRHRFWAGEARRTSWCWCRVARPSWPPACAQNKALALSRTPLAELWRHPLHTREIGSQLTNVLRCLYLEAHGYQVTVTELVGWEHSLKNELIIARRTGQPKAAAAARLRALLGQFQLESLLRDALSAALSDPRQWPACPA